MAFNASVMESYRNSTVKTRYAHGAVYSKGYRGTAHAKPWEHWMDESALRTIEAIPDIALRFPRVSLMAFMVKDGTTLVASGEGVDGASEAKFFDQLNFVEGAALGEREDGVLLGSGLARGLNLHVGDEVDMSVRDLQGNMQLETLVVTGVFFTGVPAFDDTGFRCQRTVAARALGTNKIESIFVALKDEDGFPAFARQVPAQLEAVSFDVLDEIYYKHGVDWLGAQFAVVRAIILLIVFLGIFNVISMTIVERTAEISTLRANGETPLEIALTQMLEAATIGLLGGIAGVALGWLIATVFLASGIQLPAAPGFTRSFRIFLHVSLNHGFVVMGLGMLTAVLGSLPPILRVLRVPIAEGLRRR
jgi:putative ABC transport system permease protein